MKRTSLLFLTALCSCAMQAQVSYLETNFDDGIPAEYTLYDEDELPVALGFNEPVDGNWFSHSVDGAIGKAAVSTSHHDFDIPVSNWLITPKITVESSEALFAWDARSVHFDLREGYQIMISTTDSNPESFIELCQIEKETYNWQHHVISLKNYVGKQVYLAIHHNSQKKFLLAIDNIFAGVPQNENFDAKNLTRHFCGHTETTPVTGYIRNIGKISTIDKIICTSGINVQEQNFENQTLYAGDTIHYSFEIPVTLNNKIPYQIDVVTSKGEKIRVVDESIICSYFPRTLLVEEGTGVGCTACPGVMGYMNELKEEYNDEIIEIVSHSQFFDKTGKLFYTPYDEGMSTSNYPVIYFNREQRYQSYGKSEAQQALQNILAAPTPALIEAKAQLEDHNIAVSTKIHFATDIDNTKGNYRIGFAILEKELQLPFSIQKSAISGTGYQEFGWLSSPLNKDLLFFHNTVRGTASAFKGIPKSLPAEIKAGGHYTFEDHLELPENFDVNKEYTIVAFVLDFFNTKLLNAVETSIDKSSTGIEISTKGSQNPEFDLRKNGYCTIHLPNGSPSILTLIDGNGRTIHTSQHFGNEITLRPQNWNKGTFILKIQQEENVSVHKLIF